MSKPIETIRAMWAAAGSGGHQCLNCGEVFNSESGHTAHRAGAGKDRRCKAVPEIEAAGFAKNRLGRWSMMGQEGEAWWQKARATEGNNAERTA
jgi:predicted  nucleic acid-binding Zn-ribbon protein